MFSTWRFVFNLLALTNRPTIQVDGDVYSKALVSLCNQQLHATVLAEDASFEIQHLSSNRSHGHQYIAYKLSDYIPMDNATCGGAHVPSAEHGSDHGG